MIKCFKRYDHEFEEWRTTMREFCPYKETTRVPMRGGYDFEEITLYAMIQQGWTEISYWEFGAINSGCSVEEFKQRMMEAWEDRVKNGG